MTNSTEKKKLFIIDGSACIYRAFHAIPVFTTSGGQPTNAVYGFTQTLRKILKEHSPDYVVVAYDSKGPTFRHELHEDYKATRPPMPDELVSQMPLIKRMVDAFGVASLEKQGFEADDIIATVVRAARSEQGGKLHVSIVTGDKDMYQLVDQDTDVYNYAKDTFIGEEGVRAKFGVAPDHVTDALGLAGDKSDNIPGVAGIGVKTAAKLIEAHGSIEEILDSIEVIKPDALRKKLAAHRDDALMSKKLATLDHEVPLDFTIDLFISKAPDTESLSEILRELEFVKLIKELIPAKKVEPFVEVASGEASLKKLLQAAEKTGQISISALASEDFDGKGETGHFELDGVGVASSDKEVYFVPLEGGGSFPELLKPLLEDEAVKKISPDLKPLYKYFATQGVALRGAVMDISIASYLLSPGRGSHNIDDIAARDIDGGLGVAEDAGAFELAGARARAALRLAPIFEKRLSDERMTVLFRDMELPLVEVLASMERVGVKINTEVLERLTIEMAARLETLEAALYGSAGYSFNINSPKQLSKLLFEDLGLQPVKKTKTGFSTDESVLTALTEEHEIPGKIIEYRQITKLKSTYVDSLLQLVNKEDGRVHTSFNQTVTATGRLSSSRPNMQNIPVKGEYAGAIREAFVPPEGASLLCADYSQIELRLVAHLSGDSVLIDSFINGEDIHARTASEVFGIMPGLVTPEMRRRAKAINFGIIYGMGAHGLARTLEVSMVEAADYIKEYFRHYSGVKDFIDSTIERARELGYTETIFARRRYIAELDATSEQQRRLGERMATNTPVQGAAADMIKVSMIKIEKRLRDQGLKALMILQIHDELIFEVPLQELDEVTVLVREEMEGVIELKVPVTVNITVGGDWRKSS